MIPRAGVVYETLREPRCLIAESLHPENTRVAGSDHHSLVELIEVDVCRPSRREAQAHQRLEVLSRPRLVSQNVQRKPDETAAGRHIRRIGGFGFDGAELLAESQGTTIVTRGEAIDIQPVYRSQPAPTVVHDLGKLERLRQGGAHLLAAPEGMQMSVAKREIKVHVAAW